MTGHVDQSYDLQKPRGSRCTSTVPATLSSRATELVVDINNEHKLAQSCARDAVKHATRCGELLIEQKNRLEHGEFQAWIKVHCTFSYSSAALYMKAAEQNSNGLEVSSLRALFESGRPGARKTARAEKSDRVGSPIGGDLDRSATSVSPQNVKSSQEKQEPIEAKIIEKATTSISDAKEITNNVAINSTMTDDSTESDAVIAARIDNALGHLRFLADLVKEPKGVDPNLMGCVVLMEWRGKNDARYELYRSDARFLREWLGNYLDALERDA